MKKIIFLILVLLIHNHIFSDTWNPKHQRSYDELGNFQDSHYSYEEYIYQICLESFKKEILNDEKNFKDTNDKKKLLNLVDKYRNEWIHVREIENHGFTILDYNKDHFSWLYKKIKWYEDKNNRYDFLDFSKWYFENKNRKYHYPWNDLIVIWLSPETKKRDYFKYLESLKN